MLFSETLTQLLPGRTVTHPTATPIHKLQSYCHELFMAHPAPLNGLLLLAKCLSNFNELDFTFPFDKLNVPVSKKVKRRRGKRR